MELRTSQIAQLRGDSNLQEILAEYIPRASIVPAVLDFRQCPFLWPFCKQPIYAHAMPLMFNATVLNGMGLTGEFNFSAKTNFTIPLSSEVTFVELEASSLWDLDVFALFEIIYSSG